MLGRTLAAVLAFAAASAFTCVVAAQPAADSRAEARQRFETGVRLAEQGDWASALREWQAAYALLEGHPRQAYVLYNMARAYEELRQTRRAIETYEQFLSLTAGDPNAPNRDEADRHLRELRLRRELEGGGGISPVGPIVLAVGGATLIAGAILGGVVLARDDELVALCPDSSCPESARSLAEEVQNLAISADVLVSVGAAATVAGVLLTLLLPEEEGALSAACTRNGCQLVGRF